MIWLLVTLALVVAPRPVPVGRRRSVDRWRHAPEGKAGGDVGVAWVLAVAGELRAGADTGSALQRCGSRFGVGAAAAHAARMGADIPTALEVDAARTPILRSVAAAWSVSQQTGAGLADVLERIADGHRRGLEVRRTLDVELAGPRATARLMSLLPAIGVGLATLLGADPLRWFISSVPAATCLLTGITLNLAGFLWIRRIVRGIEARL